MKSKLVIFGSPNLLVDRPKEPIWKTLFETIGERKNYNILRGQFKKRRLTALQWALDSGKLMRQVGLTRDDYHTALSFDGLRPYAKEVIDRIKAAGGRTAIISGGFHDLNLETVRLAGIDYIISQALPVFGEDGIVENVSILFCDYQGKVFFAKALAHSTGGYSLDECLFVAEGPGDIALARAMPSVAFDKSIGKACDIFTKGDLSDLIGILGLDAVSESKKETRREVPHTVLVGNQESDAVLVDFDCNPAKYESLLDRFALIGPLMTDNPGVKELMASIDGAGIRNIYVTGKPSVFRPDLALEKAQPAVKRLNEMVASGKRESDIYFVNASKVRKVFSSPFVAENFSFVAYQFAEDSMVDVYRNREKIDSLSGSCSALLENIIARYGERVSAENLAWLAGRLHNEKEKEQGVMEFKTLQKAYPKIIRKVLAGTEYDDERGEKAIEINPLAVRITDVKNSNYVGVLDEEQANKYVKQFLGEETASGFDYSIWQRMESQVKDVVTMLAKRPETRRAHILIAREDDVKKAVKGVEQPCHIAFDFVIRDNKLDMYAYLRSNDVIRAFPADAYAGMQLQMRLAEELGVEAGSYTHVATRAQIYSRDYSLAKNLIKE